MNIGAITKQLFSRSTSSPGLFLPKPHLCTLYSITRTRDHQSKTFPAAFDQSLNDSGKPAVYYGASSSTTRKTRGLSTQNQDAWDFKVETNSRSIWQDVKAMKISPLPAVLFGLSGVVPFVIPPAYMLMTQTFIPKLALAQNTFGACVLSFVGGIRYGYVIPEKSLMELNWYNMGYSALPCLFAWPALMLPETAATLAIMAGVAGATYIDTVSVTNNGFPSWYKGMRFILSLVAFLSLWTVLMCKVTLSPHVDGELDVNQINKYAGSFSMRAAESCEEDQKAAMEENMEKLDTTITKVT